MKTILVKNIIKETQDYAKSGTLVYNIAKEAINEAMEVILDLEGVDSVPTIFLNTSFGALMDEYGVLTIKQLFRFRNIKQTQIERIRKYYYDYEHIILKNKKE